MTVGHDGEDGSVEAAIGNAFDDGQTSRTIYYECQYAFDRRGLSYLPRSWSLTRR